MANVTMDLNELDKLRSDLKELQLSAKEKEKEIEQIKADKRIVRITRKFVPKKKNNAYDMWACGHINSVNANIRYRIEKLLRNSSMTTSNYIENIIDIVKHNLPKEETKEQLTTEYINFDDVIGDIRKNVEQSFVKEIAELRSNNNQQFLKLNDVENKHNEEIIKLNEFHIKDLELKDSKYNSLLKEYNDFKEEKDMRTLEQKIKDLEEELAKEKAKKWYQKF